MPHPALELTDRPGEADLRVLHEGLLAHNGRFMGPRDARRLAVFAREAGRLIGGLSGETARGFLYVDMLWVEPAQRGRGTGSALLGAAEDAARARGCRSAWLDTYDFQARPFYERHGYRLFGELGGFPNGHRRYFLTKALAAA